ncbi:MAG: hypothetical protein DRP35_01425 [Candidatus Zixiibacteriota bacterium]|nr:MAG: hypothetical protein DRP35_01425 [candidate division Zixibacteria bacterium]
MYSILLKLKRHIKRLLKVQSESRQSIIQTPRKKAIKIFFLIIFSFLIGILYPGENLYDPLDVPRANEIAVEDILAPFQITVFKTEKELTEEQDLVKIAIPYVLDNDTSVTRAIQNGLNNMFSLVDTIKQNLDLSNTDDRNKAIRRISANFPMLSETAIVQSLTKDSLNKVQNHLLDIFQNQIYKIGVLSSQPALPKSPNKSVIVRIGESENIYSRAKLLNISSAQQKLLKSLNEIYLTDSIDVEYYYLIGRNFIQPNLKVNLEEYNKQIHKDLAEISNTKEIVQKGDIIVRAGNKVNERQELILKEMTNIIRSQAVQEGFFKSMLPAFARVLFVLGAFSLLYLFLFTFRKEVFSSNTKLLAILLAFALQLFFINLVNHWELSTYLYPVAFLSILLTLLYDVEVGIFSTFILAILLGIMHRFDFSTALMTIFVGNISCFISKEVRRRSHFFKIIFVTAFAYVVYITLIENLMLSPAVSILEETKYGLINGVICSFLVIGILPVFESLFGFTTDLTLLELSDMNHTLLKRLAMEAPGTYHHSISVGNLSEAAAKAIDGNPLLARVGAYYHDIGKIEIPEYFVENQLGIKSKHETLNPSMSSIILGSHVKKGRLLGEAHDIPDAVLNFIEEHHGTMVMKYFYNKAIKNGENVDKEKFRYSGPKPQTRETGIAMLADAVEAASRTLENPKPARINNLIQKIIDDRFQSGELDQCPLTLRDLAKIKKSFAKVLIGAFHHRVEYPDKDEDEKKTEA